MTMIKRRSNVIIFQMKVKSLLLLKKRMRMSSGKMRKMEAKKWRKMISLTIPMKKRASTNKRMMKIWKMKRKS